MIFLKIIEKKFFHTFEFTLVYDIKFTNVSNKEEFIFTTTLRSREIQTEFSGVIKKINNARSNGFVFNQINKLTEKIYSNLSKKTFVII